MPTCVKCGFHDITNADFDNTNTICNTCGPHVLVEFSKSSIAPGGHEYGPHVTVQIMNVDGYEGTHDEIFWGSLYGYKKLARKHAKKIAAYQRRDLLVIYRNLTLS